MASAARLPGTGIRQDRHRRDRASLDTFYAPVLEARPEDAQARRQEDDPFGRDRGKERLGEQGAHDARRVDIPIDDVCLIEHALVAPEEGATFSWLNESASVLRTGKSEDARSATRRYARHSGSPSTPCTSPTRILHASDCAATLLGRPFRLGVRRDGLVVYRVKNAGRGRVKQSPCPSPRFAASFVARVRG